MNAEITRISKTMDSHRNNTAELLNNKLIPKSVGECQHLENDIIIMRSLDFILKGLWDATE